VPKTTYKVLEVRASINSAKKKRVFSNSAKRVVLKYDSSQWVSLPSNLELDFIFKISIIIF